MNKILITGVAGLLGSRLASWIIENTNYEVIGIDDLSGGYTENIHNKVKFYKFNLNDLESLKGVFEKEKINIVYHFGLCCRRIEPFIRKYNYDTFNNINKSNYL